MVGSVEPDSTGVDDLKSVDMCEESSFLGGRCTGDFFWARIAAVEVWLVSRFLVRGWDIHVEEDVW